MVVYLHYKMEALITKCDKLTNNWTNPKYDNNTRGSGAQIATKRAKRKLKLLHYFSSIMASNANSIISMARSTTN